MREGREVMGGERRDKEGRRYREGGNGGEGKGREKGGGREEVEIIVKNIRCFLFNLFPFLSHFPFPLL